MSPYDDVRSFASLCCCRKAICDILRRFDPHIDAKLILEFLRNGFKRPPAFGIHPDEQISVRPGVSGSRKQPKKNRQQISLHSKNEVWTFLVRTLTNALFSGVTHFDACISIVRKRFQVNMTALDPQSGAVSPPVASNQSAIWVTIRSTRPSVTST